MDCPPRPQKPLQKSVFGGLAVAQQLGSTSLLDSVRLAFVDAMDAALWASGGVAW